MSQMTNTKKVGSTGGAEGQGRAYNVNITTKTAITTLLAFWGGLHVPNAFIDRLLFKTYLLSTMLGKKIQQ